MAYKNKLNLFKVRTYMQHRITKDICKILHRHGLFNTHYTLVPIYPKSNDKVQARLSHENLEEFWEPLKRETVQLLYK